MRHIFSQCKEVFLHTFKLCCSLFIFFVLPADLLFRIDSLIQYISPLTILADTAIVTVFLMLLAGAIAFCAGIAGAFSGIFFKNRGSVYIITAADFIALCFIINQLMRLLDLWINKTFAVQFNLNYSTHLSLLMVILIWYKNGYFFHFIPRRISSLYKTAVILGCLSVLITGIRLAAVLAFTRTATAGASQQTIVSAGNTPNIILVTFDALTAEDMSTYGYHLKTTPTIDKLAEQSCVFEHAYSNSNWTKPGIASILTGTYPSTHQLISMSKYNYSLPKELLDKNIAHVLKAHGYHTAAVVSNLIYGHPYANSTYRDFDFAPMGTQDLNYIINRRPNLFVLSLHPYFLPLGSNAHVWFYQLFKTYFYYLNINPFSLLSNSYWERRVSGIPEKTVNLALSYISDARSPFFLWMHFYPPHSPYLPSAKYLGHFLKENVYQTYTAQQKLLEDPYYRDNAGPNAYRKEIQPLINKIRMRYDEHILYADSEFGRFLDYLKKNNLYDNSILIVSADHGESFTDGYLLHGGPMLYNQVMRIPLIIHLPHQQTGKRITCNAEQVDIAPTLFDSIGINKPDWMEGESLKRAMDGDYITGKPKYSMVFDQEYIPQFREHGLAAVMLDNYKYIMDLSSLTGELYDLSSDPAEDHKITASRRATAEQLHFMLLKQMQNDLIPDDFKNIETRRKYLFHYKYINFNRTGSVTDRYWTSGYLSLGHLAYLREPTDSYLVLNSKGWHPYRNDVKKLGLQVRANNVLLPFARHSGTAYYFTLSDSIKQLDSVTISSATFSPKQLGLNNDSRLLGMDVESVRIVSRHIVKNKSITPNEAGLFLEGFYEDTVWTKGNATISNIFYSRAPSDSFLVLNTKGWHPYRDDVKKLGLQVRANNVLLPFARHSGTAYYFTLSDSIKQLDSVTISSGTFSPKQLGLNNDSRLLGMDVESVRIVSRHIVKNKSITPNEAGLFLEGFYEDTVWTKGNATISNIFYDREPADSYLVLITKGWHPDRDDVKKLGLQVRANNVLLPFARHSGTAYYFTLSDSIKQIDSITISSATFSPKQLGLNNDSRLLGMDVESVRIAGRNTVNK